MNNLEVCMAIRIEMPKLGLNMKEGLLVEWLVDQGAQVVEGQSLFVVETEKVTNEVTAQYSGILHRIGKEGESFPISGLVGYLLSQGESIPEPEDTPENNRELEKGNDSAGTETSQGYESSIRTLASPKAKRRAKELGIFLEDIEGTGPNGRIGFDDVEKAAEKLRTGQSSENETIVLSLHRKTIARRMAESHDQTAPVTLMAEGDASALINFREVFNEGKDIEEKISLNALLIVVAAQILKDYPLLNSSYINEKLIKQDHINIGLAMDMEKGLLVPVINNCEEKSFEVINKELKVLYQKVATNNFTEDDLTGNTFSITNLGSLGITYFTPIINLPDVAILGIGEIKMKPVIDHGEFSSQHTIFLSLTFDHRWIDGAYGAKFLKDFLDAVESINDWL